MELPATALDDAPAAGLPEDLDESPDFRVPNGHDEDAVSSDQDTGWPGPIDEPPPLFAS